MPTTLGELFSHVPGARISGDSGVNVAAPVTDSRRVAPGSVFFAIGGLRTSGARYVGEAVLRGAAAVVVDDPALTADVGVPCVLVPDARKALALASRRFFGRPDEVLTVLGVTGTNGKTTVSMLTRHLMQQSGARPWGLVGTVRYELGDRGIPSHKTTPESVDIYGMMAGMVRAGCEGLAMEVSSHAVDQDRVHGLRFRALAFTNLSRDHMDYHGDMESYFAVKSRVFSGPGAPGVSVINADDTYGVRLAGSLASGPSRVLRFGVASDADVRAESVRLGPGGSEFDVVWAGGRVPVKTRLPGHYNVSNILCALALCHAAGRDIAGLAPLLEKFPGVPGRMEKVADGLPFEVLVDYAHTDDALRNALGMLRAITPGRVLVVFGCGGNRDRGKRPKMTAAVQEVADFAWATSDNPRREAVEDIFEDMRAGVARADAIAFVPDRRRAISLALDAARPGDCVLIAGKGHETYQEFADTTVPFDDREVARELLELKSLRAR